MVAQNYDENKMFRNLTGNTLIVNVLECYKFGFENNLIQVF